MTYHYSRPRSVYTQSNQTQSSTGQRPFSVYTQSNQIQPLAGQRPYSVVGYEGFEGFEGFEGLSTLQQQPSIRVIRRRQQRKNVRSNVLNPTLDNFYKTLRRAEADLNVKSAKSWLKEYEGYRKQVINAEKSSIVNTRPVSCYTPSLVSSPSTMEYQRYSMHF